MFRWQKHDRNKLKSSEYMTVAEYIEENNNTIIANMIPVTFGITSGLQIPTANFYSFALNLIANEYGRNRLDEEEQLWLYNDIISNTPRLIQLLELVADLYLSDLLTLNYGNRTYSAMSRQSVGEDITNSNLVSRSDANASSIGNSDGMLNSFGVENSIANARGTQFGEREYVSNDTGNVLSDTLDVVNIGQRNSTDINLNMPLPTQALQGNTGVFSEAIDSVNGSNLHVPNLNHGFSNSATQNDVVQRSATDENISKSKDISEADSKGGESFNSTDNQSNNTNSDSSISSTENVIVQSNDFSNANASSENKYQSERRLQQSEGKGIRESGFTTNPGFANNIMTLFDTLLNTEPPWIWWLDRFSWTRGVL